MFTVALFTTVKIRKQPKCTSTDNEYIYLQSVSQFSHSVVSDSLRPHGLQHASLPGPSTFYCFPLFSYIYIHLYMCIYIFK